MAYYGDPTQDLHRFLGALGSLPESAPAPDSAFYMALEADRCLRIDKNGIREVYKDGRVSQRYSWDFVCDSIRAAEHKRLLYAQAKDLKCGLIPVARCLKCNTSTNKLWAGICATCKGLVTTQSSSGSASQSWDDLIAENMKALKAIEDAKKAAQPLAPTPMAPSGGYWITAYPGFSKTLNQPDISQQDTKEMPAIEVELCSAKPPCGLPDEECGQCRAKNCPGVKCWRGCGVTR